MPSAPLRHRQLLQTSALALLLGLSACSTLPPPTAPSDEPPPPPWDATRLLGMELLPPIYELSAPEAGAARSHMGLQPSQDVVDTRLTPGLKKSLPTPSASTLAPQSLYQTGVASWYGDKFHGRLTANGERYNMNALTAAHRSLPFGTKVCVRSLLNGKEVLVRINDRGPYAGQRIIDLSRAAAERLGMVSLGLKNVSLWIPNGQGAQCGEGEVPLHGKGLPPPVNPPRKEAAKADKKTPGNKNAKPSATGKNTPKATKAQTPARQTRAAAAKPQAAQAQAPQAQARQSRANANANR
ncbi:MAG: septal ring lytic transglycosylase RlpA family protein [Comamonadaceae bacterium]|nr:septal ring lytic transglycosylase RlpA family protein [Comamonadaceae bacterium]